MNYEGTTIGGVLVSLVFIVLFFVLSLMIVRRRYVDQRMRNLFIKGLSLKLLGGLAFVLVYEFYYGGGDTFRYFRNATTMVHLFFEDPGRYLLYITKKDLDSGEIATLTGLTNMLDSDSTYLTVVITSIIGILTGNFFLVSTFCFAFLSYIGVWGLFRTACRLFPAHIDLLSIAVLFLPSFYFWGSSIMKDSIVVGFLGLLVYLSYRLLILKQFKIHFILLFLTCFYVLFNVKVYVILSFMPALFLWLVFENARRIRNKQLRLLVKPVALLAVVAIVGVGLPLASSFSEQYSVENALETAEVTANYIHRISGDGSAYNLGQISYTPAGMVQAFPKAVNVTLFRPYIWEVRNPVMLFAALEGSAFLLLTLYLILRTGLLRFFRVVSNNPFLLASLAFSVLFAFAVGVSTFNFGSLVRYKIPCLPFYGIVLAVVYGKLKEAKRIRAGNDGSTYGYYNDQRITS